MTTLPPSPPTGPTPPTVAVAQGSPPEPTPIDWLGLLKRALVWTLKWLRKAWPLWLGIVLLLTIEYTSRSVRQPAIEAVFRYGDLGSGSKYCTDLATALVAYSGFSRRCAWVAFFVGVLLGGFAVVIGPDDKEDATAGYWTKLCTKHRNVVMLLVAALFWTTAYAGFVRVGAAAEAAQLVTKHIAEAEVRQTKWSGLFLASAAEDKRMLEQLRQSNIDRELFSKCIETRGTWEVNRTRSFDFAKGVAQQEATRLLIREQAASSANTQADKVQEKRQDALETVVKAEQATASPGGGPKPEVERAQDATQAAQNAAVAASQVEREATKAANLAAGVDPVVASALRDRVRVLRGQVENANKAAAAAASVTEVLKVTPSGERTAQLTEQVIQSAGDAANAARQALTTAAQVADTVQAVAATEQTTAGPK